MKREAYVVTGAGGFIGYHLANALAIEGHCVVGVDLRFPDPHGILGPPRFSATVGDFRDSALMHKALQGATALFHLASVHLQVNAPESLYWDVNVHSVPRLLELAHEAGVSRCVHASSTGVYGHIGPAAANEETVPHPQSIYGETKLAGEKAVLEFGRRRGLNVVVLRPAWVYGPGCARTAKLHRALRQRRFFMVGDGQNLRQPVFIDDMVQALLLAAIKPDATGDVFVVAGEQAVTTRELVETFCTAFDLPQPFVRVPHVIGETLATCTESCFGLIGRDPPISRRTLEFFNTSNAFDISRARCVLGFAPRFPLVAGLAATRQRMDGRA